MPARGFDHEFGQQEQKNGVAAHGEKVSEVDADGNAHAAEEKEHDVFEAGKVADFFLRLVDDDEEPKSGQRNEAKAPSGGAGELLEAVAKVIWPEQAVYLRKEVAESEEDGKVGERDLGHKF